MRYMICTTAAALLSISLIAFEGKSQDAPPNKPPTAKPVERGQAESELAAIRAESEAFVAAFNRRDAKAVASFWTQEGEYIDDSGRRFAGREAIEKGYAEFFANNPAAEMRIAIGSLRLLGEVTAVEDGNAVVDPSPAGVSGSTRYTAIHVKTGGKWQMASVRDAWSETPPAVRSSADLAWLVGNWVAEEHGVRTESINGWVADERFLERRYSTTHVDGTKSTGVQLIGWNAQSGSVQSWDFNSDGGHAVGVWSPMPGGWQAEVRGITGGGVPTAAINLLTRLDDNAYAWQSVRRFLGETALPDTGEVIIKRAATP